MLGVAEIEVLFERYLPFIPEEYLAVLVIVGVVIAGLTFVLRTVINPMLDFYQRLKNLFGSNRKAELGDTLRPDIEVLRDVWLKERPPHAIIGADEVAAKATVISVLNMKGGVGKTTVTANLGAALKELGKRVLFIDFDYQGSLTMMVAGGTEKIVREIGVESYRSLYPLAPEALPDVVTPLSGNLSGCGISGASYALFRDEMEQFAKWSANTLDYDVRLQFRQFVLSDYVQNNFDIVLVDCGPRFTTSTINALCGSTHFLVPTILDELSTRAVSYLNKELSRHRDDLFPNLKLIGILPTFVAQDPREQPKFSAAEREQLGQLADTFSSYTFREPVLEQARIPDKKIFSKNSDGLAYFADKSAKAIFDRAAKHILKNI